MPLRPLLVSFVIGACLAAAPSAQTAPPQRPAVFRSATQYVSMDVVVTDERDVPVLGLTKNDFVITEHGRPQKIADFTAVDLPMVVRTVDLDAPPPPAADVASNARSAASSRAVVIVIDDLAINPDALVPLKRVLAEFLRKLSSDDQVALVYVSRSDLSRDFTNDLGPLIDAANGRRAAVGLAPMSTDPEREFLTTMRNVMDTLQAARQSRRAIFLISTRGCSPAPPINFSNIECKDLIEKSHRTGVPIYGLDPRLFVEPSAAFNSTLRALAGATGGTAYVGQSDNPASVDALLNQNSHYYLIGYYPDPVFTDGKFHAVDVTVRRPGLRVQTREGYSAPKAAKEVFTPKREMTADLGAGLDVPGLPIRVFAAPLGPGARGTRTAITVELMYPLPPSDRRTLDDEIRFGALALNADAKIKASFQRPSTYTGTWTTAANGRILINDVMELPSEVLTLRVGVASRALGKTGTTHLRIDVPDFGDSDLTVSPLVIGGPVGAVDAATGLDYLRGLVPFQPIVARTFAAADTLRVFARASFKPKSSVTDVTVLAQLSGPETRTMPQVTLRSSLGRDGHRDAVFDVPIALTGLAPGAYQLSVMFTTPSKGTVTRSVPIEIR